MPENPTLYIRGPYRVVAHDRAPVPRFIVLDTAGAWLREEYSLDAARDWIDVRLDGLQRAPSRVATREVRR